MTPIYEIIGFGALAVVIGVVVWVALQSSRPNAQ
jgi:hypothetical protein